MPIAKISLRQIRKTTRLYLHDSKCAPMVALLWGVAALAVCGIALAMQCLFFAPMAHVSSFPHGVAYGTACAFALFITVFAIYPFYHGIDMMIMEYVLHKKVQKDAVFSSFTAARRYWYAVRFGASRIGRSFLCVAVLYGIMRLGRHAAEMLSASGDAIRAAFVLCGSLAFLWFSIRLFWSFSVSAFIMDAAHASAPSLSYRQIKKLSKCGVKHWRKIVMRHQLWILPLYIISFMMLGVPFVFVIPYAKMAKCVLATQLLQC